MFSKRGKGKEKKNCGGRGTPLTVWDDTGEELELQVAEVVPAPPGLALAREPEHVVTGRVAGSHAAVHLAALTLCRPKGSSINQQFTIQLKIWEGE